MSLAFFLALGAAILAIVDLVRAKGYSLTAWGVLLLALIFLLPGLR